MQDEDMDGTRRLDPVERRHQPRIDDVTPGAAHRSGVCWHGPGRGSRRHRGILAARAASPTPAAPARAAWPACSSCTRSTPPATPPSPSRWPAPCSSPSPPTRPRGQVALFLVITMLPFAVVAPLIGPVPRPLPPRPPLGHRRDAGRARLLLLGAGRRRLRRPDLGRVLHRGARLPGVVQGVRRHPRRRSPAHPSLGLHPGEGQLAHLADRHGRRRHLGAARRSRRR